MKTVKEHIDYLKMLVDRGGPEESEWNMVRDWMFDLGSAIDSKTFSDEEINGIYNEIGNAFPVETIQGHTYHKPRKYAGDFELLDKIQTSYVIGDARFANWDRYFHSCAAPEAVRFRIQYLIEILEAKMLHEKKDFSLLDIASGPCRDIHAFLSGYPDADIMIDCVEHDADAVLFSKNLLKEHHKKVNLLHINFLRFAFPKKYDLIWSAGLFDYFDDNFFIRKLKLMISNLNPGGEIVVGNLSVTNPSRYYMLLFKWIVHHRTEEQLISLAKEAGADAENISVYKEPLGVNLFLHIKS